MTTPADDVEKRLAELKKNVPTRGFERHASVLKDVLELPIELQSPAVTALAARETIQAIVAFPPQIQHGWEYVPKQALLFTAAGLTHLFASIWPDQGPQVTSVEGCNLLYMKIKLILLYGCLEIVALGESAPVQLTMEFNTVDWYRLWASLQRLLQATHPVSILEMVREDSSLLFQRALKELPIKFSNGLQLFGLLPGEALEEVVFQASIWERWLYFLQRPVSANTLLLLTSHYMIVIQEELDVKQGWLLSYIPRNAIVRMRSQSYGTWNELSARLKQGDQTVDYKLTLKNESVDDWCKHWVQHGGVWENFTAPV